MAALDTTWIPISSGQFPERDQKVEWISPGGLQVRGTYAGGIIWFPEGSNVYIYYTPAYWRPLNEGPR